MSLHVLMPESNSKEGSGTRAAGFNDDAEELDLNSSSIKLMGSQHSKKSMHSKSQIKSRSNANYASKSQSRQNRRFSGSQSRSRYGSRAHGSFIRSQSQSQSNRQMPSVHRSVQSSGVVSRYDDNDDPDSFQATASDTTETMMPDVKKIGCGGKHWRDPGELNEKFSQKNKIPLRKQTSGARPRRKVDNCVQKGRPMLICPPPDPSNPYSQFGKTISGVPQSSLVVNDSGVPNSSIINDPSMYPNESGSGVPPSSIINDSSGVPPSGIINQNSGVPENSLLMYDEDDPSNYPNDASGVPEQSLVFNEKDEEKPCFDPAVDNIEPCCDDDCCCEDQGYPPRKKKPCCPRPPPCCCEKPEVPPLIKTVYVPVPVVPVQRPIPLPPPPSSLTPAEASFHTKPEEIVPENIDYPPRVGVYVEKPRPFCMGVEGKKIGRCYRDCGCPNMSKDDPMFSEKEFMRKKRLFTFNHPSCPKSGGRSPAYSEPAVQNKSKFGKCVNEASSRVQISRPNKHKLDKTHYVFGTYTSKTPKKGMSSIQFSTHFHQPFSCFGNVGCMNFHKGLRSYPKSKYKQKKLQKGEMGTEPIPEELFRAINPSSQQQQAYQGYQGVPSMHVPITQSQAQLAQVQGQQPPPPLPPVQDQCLCSSIGIDSCGCGYCQGSGCGCQNNCNCGNCCNNQIQIGMGCNCPVCTQQKENPTIPAKKPTCNEEEPTEEYLAKVKQKPPKLCHKYGPDGPDFREPIVPKQFQKEGRNWMGVNPETCELYDIPNKKGSPEKNCNCRKLQFSQYGTKSTGRI